MVSPRRWGPPGDHPRKHFGAPSRVGSEEPNPDPWDRNIEEPAEWNEDGCPGGWYRCEFVRSLFPYLRSVSSDGVYSPNLRLDRCQDPLVHDAIALYERERARWLGWYRTREHELMRPPGG